MTGLYLNLGSGQRPFQKPWVNIDAQARWEPDVVADCSSLAYTDSSAEMIVLHHVLEHFGCGEGIALQREAWRLLQPGGSLLIFVPDMRALAQGWLMGRLDDETYMINVYGAYMGDDRDRHRFGYTAVTLHQELRACPWGEVKEFNWRKVAGSDFAKAWWVLAWEAVK